MIRQPVSAAWFLLFCFWAHFSYAQDCTLVYGVYNGYKPFEWVENNIPKGINVELFEAIAQEAGCEYTLMSRPWPQMMELLRNGEVSVVSASMTTTRMEHFIQLPPAFVQYRLFIGRKGSGFISNINELSGKTILVLSSSVAHENLLRTNPGIQLQLHNSEREALQALSAGEGDYAIIDETSNITNEYGYTNLTIVSEPLFPTLYGFMLRQNNPHFARLSEAADRLKESGEYYAIISEAKNYKYSALFRTFVVSFGILAALFIFFWNRSLRFRIQQKTKGLNQEIARRTTTENALLAAKQEYEELASILQTILQRVPLLVYIIDRQANILWHCKKEKTDFSPASAKDNITDLEQDFISREFILEGDYAGLWKILAFSFPYQKQDAILLFVDDITENVRLRHELFMTSRYSALGEMAAIVAHEINNPIGCILHNFDFLWQCIPEQTDADQAKDISEAGGAIVNSLNRMKSMVDELRGYTTRQIKEYKDVDLRECIRSAVGITRFMINKYTGNFTLTLDLEAKVYGNYGHIEQMIINLLQNACHALTDKSQAIECSIERAGRHVKVLLSDQGIGMDASVLKNACNPYFTTRKESGGTGLGLSLTSRLIKEHGGYMEITSTPGKGTGIALFFPAL